MAPDKWKWTGSPFPSSCTHTHPQCFAGLHSHRCVSNCLSTDWTFKREIISETPTNTVIPSFCTDISAAGMVQALPTVGRGGSTSASSASAEVSHTIHPCFGSNSAELCLLSSTPGRSFAPSRSFKKNKSFNFILEIGQPTGCSYHKIIMLEGLEILGCALYMAIIPGIWLSRDYPTPGMPHCLIRTNGMITTIIYQCSPLPKSKQKFRRNHTSYLALLCHNVSEVCLLGTM